VRQFKAREMDWETYTDGYRDHLRQNWQRVKAWLQSLDNVAEQVRERHRGLAAPPAVGGDFGPLGRASQSSTFQ